MHDAQQHDLLPAAAKSFVATAGVRKLDTILEAGAGLGSLTAALLATGATVHASEVDPERLATLRKRFTAEIAAGKLVVHGGDARRLAPALPPDWRVVANPPFKLTSDLFRRWLLLDLHGGQPWGLDLILQYQAAQKLCGSTEVPGAHTRSSVIAHLFGEPRITKRLERTQVQPPSRVDLCGWSLRRRDDAPAAYELARIDAVLAVAFAGPRSVGEAMRGLATNVQLRRQAKEHGWDPDDHPRSLPPPAWRHLTEILARSGKLG